MEPLMYETYNPQNQTKYVNAGLFLPPIQKIYLKGKASHSYIVYEWFNIYVMIVDYSILHYKHLYIMN